ncbi:FUSC family protein [Reyranella sp.]|uniref:FUSC family protein n=1 Tax=Reyranella sp. TaxID=1929291 RepID=UPI003C7C84D0
MRKLFADIHRHDVESAIRVAAAVGLPLLALDAIDRLDLAVYAAFGGLAMLYGHSEPAKQRVESQIVAGTGLVLTIAAGMAWSASQAPIAVLGVLLALTVIAGVTLGSAMRWIPRGEMFFVLVLLIIAAIPTKWENVPLALAVGAAGAAFSVLLAAINTIGAPPAAEKPDGWRRRIASGYADLDRRQHLVVLAAATLGVLAAWSLALALRIGHPFWAAVTVAALMPALAAKDVWRRAIHLMLGTLGGVAIAALLFSFEPGPLALIAIIVICQAVAEIAVSRNYGVALLFFCPLAIGMSNLSRGAPWPPILVDRVAEAALGVAVAFLTIFVGRRILKVT